MRCVFEHEERANTNARLSRPSALSTPKVPYRDYRAFRKHCLNCLQAPSSGQIRQRTMLSKGSGRSTYSASMFKSRSVRHSDSRIRAEREYALSTKEQPAKFGDREVRMHKLGSLDAEFVFWGLLGWHVGDLVANITPGSPLLQSSLHPPLHPTGCEKSPSHPYILKDGSPSAD